MTRIFSGMRPSGKLHLGNYLGAMKNWIDLQDSAELAIYSVVDLHGITTPYEPTSFQTNIDDVILDYLAAGINPEKSLLVRQSRIPQHTQLMWLLSTITPLGWLERLPNWREKVEQVEELGDKGKSYQNNLGLLSYPVLMAADILLYKAHRVPVGEDQLAHLELTREIVRRVEKSGERAADAEHGAFLRDRREVTHGAIGDGDELLTGGDRGRLRRGPVDSSGHVRCS